MREVKPFYATTANTDRMEVLRRIFGPAIEGQRRLNVGCGRTPMPGWVNLDMQEWPGVDVVWDIREAWGLSKKFPGVFDVVLMSHTLEHIANPMPVVWAMHEILKPGGRLCIIVPHAWTDLGSSNPFHRSRFTPHTFVYFLKDNYEEEGSVGWGANEGELVADWAKLEVQMVPLPEWAGKPNLKYASEHYVNVIAEIHAVLTKKG